MAHNFLYFTEYSWLTLSSGTQNANFIMQNIEHSKISLSWKLIIWISHTAPLKSETTTDSFSKYFQNYNKLLNHKTENFEK